MSRYFHVDKYSCCSCALQLYQEKFALPKGKKYFPREGTNFSLKPPFCDTIIVVRIFHHTMCVIKVIRSRVSLRILSWEGDFRLIININLFIYYYADFRTPNCLMTLVTHDTRDHPCAASQRYRPRVTTLSA